ncbi:MAG: nitrile hydratase accessory protein [Micrococcales bacterium]|nr:nitrile hydratase accessory protein [Micrococcales bacterium]
MTTPPATPMRPADLASCGAGIRLPEGDGPVFEEPWQASVFAMAVHLNERGILAWPRFAQALGARLDEDGEYYRAWAFALIDVLAADGVLAASEVDATAQRWHDAAALTPHGRPISL